MSAHFEELAWHETPMGELSLRRRLEPSLKVDVYEVKLGDEWLMSSLFTVAEVELARLGLALLPDSDLDVAVGGLGLGFTARAALEDPRVRSLAVVEALGEVIEWHERRLLPGAEDLVSDTRTRLVQGDFFAMVASGSGLGEATPDGLVDAVLLDVDHSPRHVLHPSHAAFYTAAGLEPLRQSLRPGGVFAMWSDDPPDADFLRALEQVFPEVDAQVVTFSNHHTASESSATVYTAR